MWSRTSLSAAQSSNFPPSEMLDDVDRQYFIYSVLLERRELMQVAEHVRFEPATAGGDVDIDVAGKNLVAAAEIKLFQESVPIALRYCQVNMPERYGPAPQRYARLF